MRQWNRKLVEGLLTLALCCAPAFGQTDLVRQLASGDEEERKSAAVQIAATLPIATEGDRAALLAAVKQTLQTDGSPVVRALAARVLELGGDAGAGDVLLAALKQERDIGSRKAILYALARYPSPQTITAVLPLLNDKQQEIRGASAYALADAGDASAANALIEFLRRRTKDEDAFGRAQAARALGRVGTQAAFEVLLQLLEGDSAPDVRREAATALGRLAGPRDLKVIQSLRQARLSVDPYLVAAAEAALANIEQRT